MYGYSSFQLKIGISLTNLRELRKYLVDIMSAKLYMNNVYGVETLTEIRVINSAEIYRLLEQKSKKKRFCSVIPSFTIMRFLFTKEDSLLMYLFVSKKFMFVRIIISGS